MRKLVKFGALFCSFASALCVAEPANAEKFSQEVASSRPIERDGKYQLCGSGQCEYVALPEYLGKIDGVQSWPIAKASRAAAFVTGRLGYAVCAMPMWAGDIQCVKIDSPRLRNVGFVLTRSAGDGYTIATLARNPLKDEAIYRPMSAAFIEEFRSALGRLDQLIEYRRPATRSANRIQIRSDGLSAMAMASTECPKDQEGTAYCPPVVVGGSGSWGAGGMGDAGGAGEGGRGTQCPSGILMPESCYPEGSGGAIVDAGYIEWGKEYRDVPECKEEQLVMNDIIDQLNSPEVRLATKSPPGIVIMQNGQLQDPKFAASKGGDPGWKKYEVQVVIQYEKTPGGVIVERRRVDMHYMFNSYTRAWAQLKFKTTSGSGCPKMGV